jgi:2-oxoglutarate ferredoxin oxidoreductase subunit beta
VTGLLYVNPDPGDLHGALGTTDRPLNSLSDAELVPGQAALDRINAGLR